MGDEGSQPTSDEAEDSAAVPDPATTLDPHNLTGDESATPVTAATESPASEAVGTTGTAIESHPELVSPIGVAVLESPVSEARQTESAPAAEETTISEPSTSDSAPAPEPNASAEPPTQESAVRGEPKIIERMREPTEEEKDQIFRTKLKSLSPKGVSARKAKQVANHEKILTHLRKYGYITNDEVEKLCDVKDNTAYKYLTELEKLGFIMQLGKTGRNTRYRLTQSTP